MVSQTHEALSVPLPERVDYLTVIASLVGADVALDPDELEQVRSLCKVLEVPDAEAEKIVETARRPTHSVVRHIDSLKGSHLRFALLTDCIALAYADGEYAKGERTEILSLAHQLGVTDEQVAALEDAYRSLHAAEIKEHWNKHHDAAALANKLARVGIPLGIAGGISAYGLTTAGVVSGASAVAMGLGVATGFGAVLGAGLGTIVGVRWLHERIKKGK